MNPHIEKLAKTFDLIEEQWFNEKALPQLKEFILAFKKALTEVKKELHEMVENKGEDMSQKCEDIYLSLEDCEKRMKGMMDKYNGQNDKKMSRMMGEMMSDMEKLRDEMPVMPDMSAMEARHNEIEVELAQIKAEQDAKSIKVKLESLKGNERLDKSAIKGLDDEIKRLEERIFAIPSRTIGGGVSNLRIQQAFKYILKTEEPVGDIDGANTTYTLSQPIFAILSMSINGETIAQIPNYTISGNRFTFTTALPAAYSGKDWEVKYI